nr:MAG TPA: hypothetical protein [Caudoviricetes sp.]
MVGSMESSLNSQRLRSNTISQKREPFKKSKAMLIEIKLGVEQ